MAGTITWHDLAHAPLSAAPAIPAMEGTQEHVCWLMCNLCSALVLSEAWLFFFSSWLFVLGFFLH